METINMFELKAVNKSVPKRKSASLKPPKSPSKSMKVYAFLFKIVFYVLIVR